MTSYARAIEGYDDEHERELLAAITAAVVETSKVNDANAIALRTGEIASALLSLLAATLAMSATSPTARRHTVDEVSKELRRRVTKAETNSEFQVFLRGVFRGNDVGGSA